MFRSQVHVLTVKPGFVRTKMTEHIDLPKLLTATPESVGQSVKHAFLRKRNIVYTLAAWRWIMLIIRLLPEFVFKRLSL